MNQGINTLDEHRPSCDYDMNYHCGEIQNIWFFHILVIFSESHFLIQWKDRSSPPEVFLYYKKVFWKYAANLQENTHAEAQFQ